jgi:poly(hydroxyalkanoate) depolymerase family esterase
MNTKLARVCFLIAVCHGLFTALPAKAASLQLVPNWGASGVPTNLSMYIYVPDKLATNPPILVLLHYWGGGASGVFAEAQAGGIVAAADQYGFIMVVPQNPDCWDVSSTATLTHDGGGHTQGIAQMVKYAINTYQANSNRVYVTGTSCGAEMTEALLAVYPDIFKAGAAFSGQVVGGAWTPITHTAQEWGDIARACYPGYSGPRPRVQLWHGTADSIINYSNQVEAIMQWGNVLGLSTNPTSTLTVTIPNITNQWTHQIWRDTNGAMRLDAWSEINGPHGTDANLDARYVIPFLGLDQVGSVDPAASGQRGRPHLNAARTTFVADNGQPLRGPYTSTEWTSATDYTNIAKMKALGFNAVHLYGESFDESYPTNGSTAPGYATNRIDSIVQSTRDLGLYLVITIGNGAWNGDYNQAYITNFWALYGARYANETHVLFEIQNEPVAWGPPYSATNATPPGALDMEVAAYKTIRTYAPNTPVLLFTYAVLGDSGGASAALTDIHAFNTNVFGNANAVWTNEAVGFHGYAGASAMSNAVSQIIAAGYPCFMTEFGGSVWGTGVGGLDAYGVADLERLGVSWLTFQYIPPTGVSDDVTDPKHYANIVNWSGLSWTPDYGNWPPVRSPYGHGGYPWSTPDYTNNLLTGSLRIQAENFDAGGEGVAYHELTTTNLGGQYRTNEAVDIETTSDTGGGYDVTGTAAGEWLEYTLYVSEPGLYNLALRVAGTSGGSVQFLAGGINGTNLTGAWTVAATGGAQTWTTISNTVFLTPGQQVLHLGILAGGFNLNWLQLSPVTAGILANGSYKLLNQASTFAVTGVAASNIVNAAAYTGATAQQWNLQHIGGGEYTITSAANGWSLVSGSGFYWWNNNHYLIQSTGNGYYRIVPTASGFGFEATTTNQSVIDEQVSAGSLNQQWAILSPAAPAFPTGLSAVAAGSTTAYLTWNAATGAMTYNVKRSTNSGGAYATVATGVTSTNYTDSGLTAGVKYFYVVSAVMGGVEGLNSAEAQLRYPKLSGTIIGTAGSWGNSGNTITNVFDNNLNTFFDAATGNGVWVGLDFGAGVSNVITQINYCPRSGFESRMTNGIFRGANQANFSDAVTLFTVASQPGSGVFTMVNITNATAFRYVYYLSPNNGYGNVAELEFYGYPASALPVPPTPDGLIATAVSSGQINLVWNVSAGATSYNVKRSTTNGGPYLVIASGSTTTNFNDTGLVAATTYYYVVSALNAGSESTNSVPVSATTAMPPPAAPVGLTATTVSVSLIHLTWPASSGAASYNVKRSITNGGPYTVAASGVVTTNYNDTSLAGGTIYYYVVSAVNSSGESTNSAQASTATLSPTLGSLVHRYSFSETGGASIADSVGGPVWAGTLPSGGTLAGGQMTLASASSQYANLPVGIVGSLSNFTMITWVKLNSTTNWSRIFDFGSGTTTNMFITPQNGGDGRLRFAMTTNGGGSEQQINSSSTLSAGVWYQVAVTLKGNTGVLYLNGLPVGTNSAMTLNPSLLGSMGNNYLGRSQYPDPYFDGMMDEFRIYNTALSSAEMAATAALGSSQLLSTNSPQMSAAISGTNLSLSWPLECAGYALQSRTNLMLGNWGAVPSPAPQIVVGQWQVALPPATNAGSVFYRLVK